MPREPREIAEDALACLAAGAAIVHNHIDLAGVSGVVAAARYLEAWKPVLTGRPDALVYPTINFGAPGQPHDYEHITPLATSGLLRIGLSDPGSVTTGDTATNGPPAVEQAVAICEKVGRPVASCDEAAVLMDLPTARAAAIS